MEYVHVPLEHLIMEVHVKIVIQLIISVLVVVKTAAFHVNKILHLSITHANVQEIVIYPITNV